MADDLSCDFCGYDLRAQPEDGTCPECGGSVAQSRRLAAIPRRPAWRDSDPRWRRRVLAGAWVLASVPVVEAIKALGWAARMPVPNVFGFPGTVRTLDETFAFTLGVYEPLAFCVGVALLCAKERGRRGRPRLDWTRRWGVLCAYVTLLLSAAPVLFIGALVLAGISALFLAMPLEHQPGVTQLLVTLSTGYMWYGPQPKAVASLVVVASSSLAVLLACVPLFDALRSTGAKRAAGAARAAGNSRAARAAAILLAPLALFAVMHLAQAGRYGLGFSNVSPADVDRYAVYFSPELLVGVIARLATGQPVPGSVLGASFVDAAKWCIVLAIAVWLTVARLAAWRRGKETTSAK